MIRKAIDACAALTKKNDTRISELSIDIDNEKWKFDNIEEFLSQYGTTKVNNAEVTAWWDSQGLMFSYSFWYGSTSTVRVQATSRADIESIFSIFEEAPADDKIAIEDGATPEITVFIGHGQHKEWEKLKSHLQDKHDVHVIAYETGARAGHSIRDILDRMANDSSFALLVLTGEDKSEDGVRARQNVIHECGLFQGRLGFDRAIMLVEEGIKLASNFDGIQQLRFRKGRISETFGDVIATLRREFGPI